MGLDDLYREIILDHYRSPRNRGELPTPPAARVEGFNPLCGDEVILFVDVEDGKVTDYEYKPEQPKSALVTNEVFIFTPGPVLDLAAVAGEFIR